MLCGEIVIASKKDAKLSVQKKIDFLLRNFGKWPFALWLSYLTAVRLLGAARVASAEKGNKWFSISCWFSCQPNMEILLQSVPSK